MTMRKNLPQNPFKKAMEDSRRREKVKKSKEKYLKVLQDRKDKRLAIKKEKMRLKEAMKEAIKLKRKAAKIRKKTLALKYTEQTIKIKEAERVKAKLMRSIKKREKKEKIRKEKKQIRDTDEYKFYMSWKQKTRNPVPIIKVAKKFRLYKFIVLGEDGNYYRIPYLDGNYFRGTRKLKVYENKGMKYVSHKLGRQIYLSKLHKSEYEEKCVINTVELLAKIKEMNKPKNLKNE